MTGRGAVLGRRLVAGSLVLAAASLAVCRRPSPSTPWPGPCGDGGRRARARHELDPVLEARARARDGAAHRARRARRPRLAPGRPGRGPARPGRGRAPGGSARRAHRRGRGDGAARAQPVVARELGARELGGRAGRGAPVGHRGARGGTPEGGARPARDRRAPAPGGLAVAGAVRALARTGGTGAARARRKRPGARRAPLDRARPLGLGRAPALLAHCPRPAVARQRGSRSGAGPSGPARRRGPRGRRGRGARRHRGGARDRRPRPAGGLDRRRGPRVGRGRGDHGPGGIRRAAALLGTRRGGRLRAGGRRPGPDRGRGRPPASGPAHTIRGRARGRTLALAGPPSGLRRGPAAVVAGAVDRRRRRPAPPRAVVAATLGALLLTATAISRGPELADTVADVRYRGEVQGT